MVQYILRCGLTYLFCVIFMFETKMRTFVTSDVFLLVIFCAQCAIVVAEGHSSKAAPADPKPIDNEPTHSSNITSAESSSNETSSDVINANITLKNNYSPSSSVFSIDNGAVKRTFYVVASLTGLVLVYISVKAIRTRTNKKRKTRRYGLLIDQEMDPLDGDDDDEDTTLFEATKHKKKIKK